MITDRKPNCKAPGSACLDPRFVGADGIVYYFHGRRNEHFTLVSDVNLQINARFIGLRPEGRTRDYTWIQALGILFNSHNFSVEATPAATWNNEIDHLKLSYNGEELVIPEGHLSKWQSPQNQLRVERTSSKNSVTVTIPEIAEIYVNVVHVTKEDSRIHNYQIPDDDCFVHLEVQFKFYDLSSKVEGVLGRTYQPDFQNPAAKLGVAMPIVGGEDKYRTTSLLSADCGVCMFDPSEGSEKNSIMEYSMLDCTGVTKSGNGIIIGTQSKVSSIQEKHVPVPQSKNLMIANSSRSSVKYPQMDELPQLKLLRKKQVPELSKFSFSDNGGTNTETLSRCENSVMQQNLVKATNLSDEKSSLLNIETTHHEQQYNDVNDLYGIDELEKEQLQMVDAIAGESNNISLPSASRQVESLDQKGDFSDDLVNSIKRIESRILALRLCSNLVESTKNSTGHNTMHKVANLDSPVIQRKDETAGSQFSRKRPPLDGNRLMKQQLQHMGISSYNGEGLVSSNAFEEPFPGRNESWRQSQVPYQNHGLHISAESARSTDIPKQIGTPFVSRRDDLRNQNRIRPSARNMGKVDRVKSLNKLARRDTHLGSHASECIQGLKVPLNEDDLSNMPSVLVGHANRENLVRKNPVAWSNQNNKERSSESKCGKKLIGSKASTTAKRENPLPHQIIIRPTLLDQRSSEIKVLSRQHENSSVLDKRGTHRTNHAEPWKTRVQPQHEEPEESSSNSHSSSRWTTQEDSTNSSSDSEEYSSRDGTQGASSRRLIKSKFEGSSEESSNSYPYKDDGSSSSAGSLKNDRYGHKRNPGKKIGSLRKLKNKLGLIFHHHHHHHHHHLHGGDDNVIIHPNAGHKHSMWNHLQNAFHQKNKHVVLRKGMVDKTRKGAIAKVTNRNQVGQFHRLVEGILTHIRHSKKPNPSKLSGVKGSRSTPHRHSHKKLQPWQILRRKRGVLKDRGRVKTSYCLQQLESFHFLPDSQNL
ncbi:unnamed protein product [Lupinus luteus]|uniref:Uncharacterized protein n=1 Tax=Lupinus luteus TaxID=3873 RepID=A0AAV1YJJ7_LUPLU